LERYYTKITAIVCNRASSAPKVRIFGQGLAGAAWCVHSNISHQPAACAQGRLGSLSKEKAPQVQGYSSFFVVFAKKGHFFREAGLGQMAGQALFMV
jgi:hypothetical protein